MKFQTVPINKLEDNTEVCIHDLFKKYSQLISDYFSHWTNESENNNLYNQQIFLRGIQTISHVFRFVIIYTKNLDLAFSYAQKSIIYYIEFISQIGNDTHTYLQLGTRDALLFVYKKSIFEFGTEQRDTKHLTKKFKLTMNIFENINTIYYILINNLLSKKNNKKSDVINLNISIEKLISYLKDIKQLDLKIRILLSCIRYIKNQNIIDNLDYLIKKIKKTNYTICEIESKILKENTNSHEIKSTLDKIFN